MNQAPAVAVAVAVAVTTDLAGPGVSPACAPSR